MPKRTNAEKEQQSIQIEPLLPNDDGVIDEEDSDEESEYSGLEDEPDTDEDDEEESEEEDEEEVENNILKISATPSEEQPTSKEQTDEQLDDTLPIEDDESDNEEEVLAAKTDNKTDDDDIDSLDSDVDDDDHAAVESSEEEDGIHMRSVQRKGVKSRGEVKKYEAKFEEADTSDEEDIRNTVGNIPMEWYGDYTHIGYNLKGKKILKPKQADQLDSFLSKMDDPEAWRTVYDKTNMKNIKLSDEEVDIIERIRDGHYPEGSFDPYAPYVDWFTSQKMVMPIKDNPESKSSFIPSKWEHKRVMRIVRAIRNGWIKPKQKSDGKPVYYQLWDKDDRSIEHPMHWPAPKLSLPGHEESYNPPPEYLPTEEERAQWEAMDPEDRPQNFLSQKYDALRKVPGYNKFIQEKFERCLDLYLCPRQRKIRLQVDPEDLIPKLPRPRDLQPFPSVESIVYRGHTGCVRCISVDPTGQWLASGADDCHIHLWEVSTGRCLKKIQVSGTIHSIQWNSSLLLPILAVAVQNHLLIINPMLGDKLLSSNIDSKIKATSAESTSSPEDLVKWQSSNDDENKIGIRLRITHEKDIKQVNWHSKGDYLSTVCPNGNNKSVFIHQLSKQKSQCPFKKAKGLVQCSCFHPTRPFFFVATQRNIRVYNLQKQELVKKLMSGVKWISSIAVHPQGDNLIVGSYDKRLCWFDMDLSSKPYKILRHHKRAIRDVAYHKCYPLFASASDDGSTIVCHGKVYSDLMQNPLIVPLKVIRGHKMTDDLGVTSCEFHPHQPWLFSAGADHTIRLFT